MERIYGVHSVLLKHQPWVELDRWIEQIELSDPDVIIFRYPEATMISGLIHDATWLIVDDLIAGLGGMECH